MKKIKLFLCVALFGAMSYGAFTAYDHYTMSEEERFLLANIEALSNNESPWDGVLLTICSKKGGTTYCPKRNEDRLWIWQLRLANWTPDDEIQCPECPDQDFE